MKKGIKIDDEDTLNDILKGVGGERLIKEVNKACMLLIVVSHDMNADKATYTWKGVRFKKQKLGDWEIKLKKKNENK